MNGLRPNLKRLYATNHPFLTPLALVAVLALGACDRNPEPAAKPAAAPDSKTTAAAPASPSPIPPPLAAPSAEPPKVIFLGDSLTAGLGVSVEEAFPARVGEILAAEGHPIQVINAGVSGDISAGGASRLAWLLRQKPAVVVVELGANDGMRGQPLADLEKNLLDVVRRSQAAGAKVLILGMKIPPNYGKDYSDGFDAIYPRVAKETGAALMPFLLEGVGGDPELNQADGIHPTVAGHKIVAKNVAPYLARLVVEVGSATNAK
ncbi:MAG: arylesterase [Acidobacteriota bacterium]